MRPILRFFASMLAVGMIATAQAQEGGIVERRPGLRPEVKVEQDFFRSFREQLNPIPDQASTGFTIEGLPMAGPGKRLTWDRAYALALLRAREPGKPLAATLDPTALDEQPDRPGIADFGQFRQTFLADEPGHFIDPSRRYYDLVARSEAIHHAFLELAAADGLLKITRELVKGEASGLTEPQVDQVNGSVQKARLVLLERHLAYRGAFDDLKVELGLSPEAPVWLDDAPTLKFRKVFEAALRWTSGSSRDLIELNEIIGRLPRFGDLEVSGLSLLETTLSGPQGIDAEAFVRAAGRLAVAGRGPAEPSRDLDVRKRLRKMAGLAVDYEVTRQDYLLEVRQRMMAQDRLFAPPQPHTPANGPATLDNLVAFQDRILASEDRLVSDWTSYHSLRLGLHRDLKLMPVDIWKDFRDRMLDGQEAPKRGGAVPVPAPIPVRPIPSAPPR